MTGGTSTYHPNVMANGRLHEWTVRYNEIYNWQDEGIMMDLWAAVTALNVNW